MKQNETAKALTACRQQIDQIDRDITKLFLQRLEVAERIGAYKRENQLPVEDLQREREKLEFLRQAVEEGQQEAVCRLFGEIIKICKDRQNDLI